MNATATPGIPRGFLSFKSRGDHARNFQRMFYTYPFTGKCELTDDKYTIRDRIEADSERLENEHPHILEHL